MPEPVQQLTDDARTPFLAYTRKYGWVVVVPVWASESEKVYTAGRTRPSGGRVMRYDVLATAPLPPVPEAAL